MGLHKIGKPMGSEENTPEEKYLAGKNCDQLGIRGADNRICRDLYNRSFFHAHYCRGSCPSPVRPPRICVKVEHHRRNSLLGSMAENRRKKKT